MGSYYAVHIISALSVVTGSLAAQVCTQRFERSTGKDHYLDSFVPMKHLPHLTLYIGGLQAIVAVVYLLEF